MAVKFRILVVEDDQAIRETLGIVLESADYEVSLARDGDDAINAMQDRWPDVILLDLTLETVPGEEVYRRMTEKFGRVAPTIVLSAAQHGEDRVRLMPGAQFLAKPYTIDQLLDQIRRAIVVSKVA